MHDGRPNDAHEQGRIARMTHHRVRTGRDQLVVLLNALHERKVWTEGSEGDTTDDSPRDDEERAQDEWDGQLARASWSKRVEEC